MSIIYYILINTDCYDHYNIVVIDLLFISYEQAIDIGNEWAIEIDID